jgi:hypothetical protein
METPFGVCLVPVSPVKYLQESRIWGRLAYLEGRHSEPAPECLIINQRVRLRESRQRSPVLDDDVPP